ncbi:MAG: 16S rRNA (cytidine(1402)-2'-O)-methyltransferase [Syntrophaceae bacterium]
MNTAKLFIVPTPIGNLKDITLRALETLAMVDVIVCEDTRHTLKLLNHYQIKKTMFASEKFSEAKKAGQILKLLEQGSTVALVSDAGTPLISDPGAYIVARARQAGYPIEALPGACAFVTALSASGFTGGVRFIGFFPRPAKQAELERMRMLISPDITVFYESPRRIRKTLERILPGLEDREACIAREISKVHEEYRCGKLAEIVEQLPSETFKGEFTVVIQGLGVPPEPAQDSREVIQRARSLLKQGYSRRDIMKLLGTETGMKRNTLYRLLINCV